MAKLIHYFQKFLGKLAAGIRYKTPVWIPFTSTSLPTEPGWYWFRWYPCFKNKAYHQAWMLTFNNKHQLCAESFFDGLIPIEEAFKKSLSGRHDYESLHFCGPYEYPYLPE